MCEREEKIERSREAREKNRGERKIEKVTL
jgi:hypothetical protein